jgi:D-alanyl-D-alanine carboxypeptidase
MKTHLKIFLLLLILVAAISGSTFAQTTSKQLQSTLQQKIDSVRAAIDIPSMAFSCILPSGEQVTVASGMKPEQRMLAGSTGKTFFSSVALQLVKDGKLSLDEKVSTYLGKERWYNKIQNAETITIRQLMNHTAGIEEYYELGDFMQRLRNEPDKTWTPVECIGYTFDRPPLFAAGTDWSYADTNYLILGLVLEKILKEDTYKVIQRNFISSNALKNTEPSVKRKLDNQVVGISGPSSPFGISGPVLVNGQMIINPQMEWAGGGFISNTIDLARWAKIYYEANFLTEAIRTEMRKGIAAKTGKNHEYALGMQIRPSSLGTSYGHGGWFPGYLTEMDFFPDKKLAVAIQLSTDDFQKLKRGPRFYEMFFAAEVARHLLP